MSSRGGPLLGRLSYGAVFVLCSAVAISWLVLGGTAAVLRYWPELLDSASVADATRSVLDAAARATEPLSQLLVDDVLSLIGIGVAVVLVVMARGSWPVRLLALALVGSAATFNLQSDAIAEVLGQATGLPLEATLGVGVRALACVAFILVLLLFPTPTPATWWRARAPAPRVRALLAAAGVVLLVAVGIAATQLHGVVSCVLFFGFVVPAVGFVGLPRMVRRGPTHQLQTQARVIFAVLLAAMTVNSILGLSSVALSVLGAPGLELAGVETGDEPIALLFWSSRASEVAIAAAVLLAVLPTRPWGAERIVGRGLAAVLTIVVVGGAAVGVESVGWTLALGAVPSSLLAAAVAGAVFLPVHLLAEGLTDRLLYGLRPTPYRALADVANLAHTSATTSPDLEDVARAVGQALGAADCRITVRRHSLPDRTYQWATSDLEPTRPVVSVPIRHGEEQIGTLAVEHAAVAGLHADRRQLLEDIADGLGGVLATYRIGIELERQLRAALAHGAEIARSRRRAVSEMDAERRRIERDLHDGVQHHLVSLGLALGLVEFEAGSGQIGSAIRRLEALAGMLDAAEAVLTETVRGAESVLLPERGLVAALEAELAASIHLSIDSELPSWRRYPAEVESTVYFCCLELVNNAAKHAPGASVIVRFSESGGRLRFSVIDDGPGFDPQPRPGESRGRGLRNLRQRIVGIGGWIDIRSAPGTGTTVDGVVPVPLPSVAPDAAHELDHGSARQARISGQTTSVLRIVGPGSAPNLSGDGIVGSPGHPSFARFVDLPRQRGADEETERFRRGPGDGMLDPFSAAVDAGQRPLSAGESQAFEPDRSLVAEVHALVAAAREGLAPAAAADLSAVEGRLRRPMRVGFRGLDGGDLELLVHCVFPTGPPPDTEFVAVPTATSDLDALVVVHGGGRGWAPLAPGHPMIVMLGDDQVGPDADFDPGLGARPLTVVRVNWRIACAAIRLTEADYATLRAGRPVPALGPAGNGMGLSVARKARTLSELITELIGRSGIPALREALHHQLFARAHLLRGRDAVAQLTAIVSRLPQGGSVEGLRYGLDRVLASRHELAESALLDELQRRSTTLAEPDRGAALRLLGAAGLSITDRLGLPATAAPRDIELAARTELARWRRVAANPVGPVGRRPATAILIRACEQILDLPSSAAAARTSRRSASRHRP